MTNARRSARWICSRDTLAYPIGCSAMYSLMSRLTRVSWVAKPMSCAMSKAKPRLRSANRSFKSVEMSAVAASVT
eukprot:7118280-Heterocapsa_arctica.AAC.1